METKTVNIRKYFDRFQDFESRWWYTGYHLDFLLLDFEVAPREYQVKLSRSDAILYCFSLNIDGKTGWRLPTNDEIEKAGMHHRYFSIHWSDQKFFDDRYTPWVVPVRDVKYGFVRKTICKLLRRNSYQQS